jgi:predicted ATPase/DNA-binding SARP family transcriptional activator
MELRTLGGLELVGGEVARRRPLLLAAYLALEGAKDRRHLAELFWGDTKDPAANLRVALTQLRAALGDRLAVARGRVGTTLRTDAQELLADLERGVAERIDAYRGPFLAGVDGPDVVGDLAEWVEGTRSFLASRVRAGLIALAERRAERYEGAAARELAERALAIGPMDELDPDRLPALHAVLAAGGSPEAARVAALAGEYGMVLEARPAAPLSAPDAVDLPAPGTPRSTLPRSTTPFVGRVRELAHAAELLDRPDVRLVTLHGGAGTGKTRLAIEVARRRLDAGRAPDGAFFVDLSAVRDVAALPDRVAAALGMVVQRAGDEVDQLARAIGTRRLLVVLDNVEHLVAAAPAVGRWLGQCPGLVVVATSRLRLGLPEEWRVPVGGLEVPTRASDDPSVILGADAAQLFARRTARVRGRPVAATEAADVRRVCEAVAGNPLALELAAPWTRVLPLTDLANELEHGLDLLQADPADGTDGHGGLRAAFERSWRLLAEGDRRTLRRLATFRGGFDRETAAAVADATLPQLARLVDASLIAMDDTGRFDRHPLLFAFAQERLAADPAEEAEVRARHGRVLLDLVRDLNAPIMGGDAAEVALRRLRLEEANVATAWAWALEAGEWDRLQRALPCVAAYAEFQARYHYGHHLADAVAQRVAADAPEQRTLLALARAVRGFSVFRAGDPRRVEADGRAALELLAHEDAADPGVAEATWWSHHCLAMAGKVRADADACIDHSVAALELAEAALAAPPPPERVPILSVMAGINHHVVCLGSVVGGDVARAARHDRASRAHLRRVDSHGDAYGAQTTALLALLAGDAEGAVTAAKDGLGRSRRVGYGTATANLLEVLARAELARGRLDAAAAACAEARSITSDVGDVWLGTSLGALEGTLAAARGDPAGAAAWYARSWALAEEHALHGYGMEAVLGRAHLALAAGDADTGTALIDVVRAYRFAPSWIRQAAETVAAERPPPPSTWPLERVRAALLPA